PRGSDGEKKRRLADIFNPYRRGDPRGLAPKKRSLADALSGPKFGPGRYAAPKRSFVEAFYPKFGNGRNPYGYKPSFADLLRPYFRGDPRGTGRPKNSVLDGVRYFQRHGHSPNTARFWRAMLQSSRNACDPAQRQLSYDVDAIGHGVRNTFINNRKFCKLNAAYSGVSPGQVVKSQKYGFGVVADVELGLRKTEFVRYRDPTPTQRTSSDGRTAVPGRFVRKPSYVAGVKNLIIVVPNPNRKGKRDAFKRVRLDTEETKEIMLASLIKRNRYDWVVRMYPEERENLLFLRQKYSTPKQAPNP
ncbi:MAG: hypothetical protein RMM53_13630, partial [Bacteroidia bacterium]|nr:hypothetical protein [Bacteroidia bacterium]